MTSFASTISEQASLPGTSPSRFDSPDALHAQSNLPQDARGQQIYIEKITGLLPASFLGHLVGQMPSYYCQQKLARARIHVLKQSAAFVDSMPSAVLRAFTVAIFPLVWVMKSGPPQVPHQLP